MTELKGRYRRHSRGELVRLLDSAERDVASLTGALAATRSENDRLRSRLDELRRELGELRPTQRSMEVVEYFLDRLRLRDEYELDESATNEEDFQVLRGIDLEKLVRDVGVAQNRQLVNEARKRLGLKGE